MQFDLRRPIIITNPPPAVHARGRTEAVLPRYDRFGSSDLSISWGRNQGRAVAVLLIHCLTLGEALIAFSPRKLQLIAPLCHHLPVREGR